VAGRVSRRRGIAFLCCVDDEARFERLQESLALLERPASVELGVFAERGATSLASAYNRLLDAASEWRYKAYVHQDVLVLNHDLIHDVLRIFRRPSIGLVGAAGCRYLPESCVWWDGSGVLGRVVHLEGETGEILELEQPAGLYEPVEAVDGLCLITQHDLPWDESIGGFHLYDVAQSTRFILAGYDVVVPRQREPWFAHEHEELDSKGQAEFLAARDAFRARYDERRRRFARSPVRRRLRRLTTAARVSLRRA
jgi:hypothetical protein